MFQATHNWLLRFWKIDHPRQFHGDVNLDQRQIHERFPNQLTIRVTANRQPWREFVEIGRFQIVSIVDCAPRRTARQQFADHMKRRRVRMPVGAHPPEMNGFNLPRRINSERIEK